jgi:chromosome segregation ATPase
MAFKTTKNQLARRDTLAAELRSKAKVLNTAIADFNRQLEPIARAVAEAQTHYNETMESARTLASEISGPAQEQFDAKSEKWQDSDAGVHIRTWIEQWEMSLDDVELDVPEPLEEIDPEEHAGALESGPGSPAELAHIH